MLVLRYTVSIEDLNTYQLTAADVNRDGTADSSDALMIPRISFGLDSIREPHYKTQKG